MRRVDSLEKTLMLGGIGGRRRRRRPRMRRLDGISDSMDMSLSVFRELVIDGEAGVLQFMGSQRVGHDWATELNWTEAVIAFLPRSKCLLISWLQLPSEVILEPRKIKSVTVSIVFPSICHEVLRILLGLKLFTGCPWHKEWNQTLIMAHKTVSGLLLLFSLAVPLPQWSFSSSTRPSSFRSWGLEICSTLLWYL